MHDRLKSVAERRLKNNHATPQASVMTRLGTMLQIGRTFGVRHGLLRLEYELQRGSGLISRRMRSVQGWESWNLKRIAPNTSPEDFLSVRRQGGHPFFLR